MFSEIIARIIPPRPQYSEEPDSEYQQYLDGRGQVLTAAAVAVAASLAVGILTHLHDDHQPHDTI